MVTLITEKLQNQTLEDVKAEANMPITQASDNTWTTFTTSSNSAFTLTGKNNWAMFVNSGEKWKFGGESFSMVPTEAATAPSATNSLATSGASTMNSRISGAKNVMQPHKRDTAPIPFPSRSRLQSNDSDSIANTPPAPPKKRHCRSLSIPGDTCTGKTSGRKWQPSGGGVWRPVGLRAHNNNKHSKNRNSPLSGHHHHHHHHQHHNHRSHDHSYRSHDSHPTAVFQCSSKASGTAGGHRGLTAVRSSSPTFSISTASRRHSTHQYLSHFNPTIGTGGVPGRGVGVGSIWPLSKSEDFATPPDSPVPRPHSASSGFCESNGSLNSFRLETKTQQNSLSCLSSAQQRAMEAFRMRSLSMEEPMTRRSLPMCSAAGARSMPAIPGCTTTTGSHTGTASMPSSPRRQRVPRCRSQPCVLLDRKCLKRRRDEHRPKLDFLKMKETAYDRMSGRVKHHSGPHFNNPLANAESIRSSRSLASLFTESPLTEPSGCPVMGLNTIASSPLDSTLPSTEPDLPARPRKVTISDGHSAEEEDSGCSDNEGLPPELATFDSEENSCSCDDVLDDSAADHDDPTAADDDDGQMFKLEINNDDEIDLDQIENDDPL